jgi:hypothetical protein
MDKTPPFPISILLSFVAEPNHFGTSIVPSAVWALHGGRDIDSAAVRGDGSVANLGRRDNKAGHHPGNRR